MPEDVKAARTYWAKEFVDQCVTKGLRAIALTDHHEMIMAPYVRRAIVERTRADPDFDLWLFPGMELTARGGTQCLIIFDTGLSEEWHEQAQGKLGIEYAALDKLSAVAPQVTQLSCHYPEIAILLDEVEGLRGRYIVLPNVSQGNNHTVLTDGRHGDFRRMTYVGGYLDRDQTINTLTSKNRSRLSGTDTNWSRREIYPLPTSDSREADFVELGRNNTWIKLAEPTAESIRQAFLGHRSRIRVEPPRTPSLFVATAEVERSTILPQAALSLSPEFNAIIGGRGTGKSSFLEYVSFGLGLSCYDAERNHYSGTSRMRDLINDTIVSKGGRVSLTITQDNATFTVVRGPATATQPQIKYPNGTTQTVTVKELRRLFPAVVYSQGELAEIGKQADTKTQLSDLLQFVNPDYKQEDDRLALDIDSAKSTVRLAIQAVVGNWQLQSQLRKLTASRDSLRQRAEALEKTLPTLSADNQKIVDYFKRAQDFEAQRVQSSKHADQIVKEMDSAAIALLSERNFGTDLIDDGKDVSQRYQELFSAFKAAMTSLRADLAIRRAALARAEQAWATKFEEARAARDGVLTELGAHKTATGQIIKLREEAANITNQISDLDNKLNGYGDPSQTLNIAIGELRQLNEARAVRTQEWASEIQSLSSGKVKAVVIQAGDISEIRDAADVIAAKTGSQEATRIRGLEEEIAKDTVANVIDRLRTDCLALLYWRQIGAVIAVEFRPNAESGPTGVEPMRLTIVAKSTSGVPRQFIAMCENNRCSRTYGMAFPPVVAVAGITKSWTCTRCGVFAGRQVRPAFLNAPTSSFFLVSTEIVGCCCRCARRTRRAMYRNCASRSTCWRPSRVLALPCRL